jgi:uncharacterized damage-inducible protein DinB
MITIDHLNAMYARNLYFIKEYTKGLSHADSLVQPPAPGNCINWVIGHMLVYRNRILQIAGQPAVFDPTTAARYTANSKPVLGDEPGIGILEDMLQTLDESQEMIAAAMKGMSAEASQKMWSFGQLSMSAGEWMLFLLRHEAFHTGNLELLREIALAKKAAGRASMAV